MKQIAAQLGVSPGTVHAWTHDIRIRPEHEERNRSLARRDVADQWRKKNRERRRGYQLAGKDRAGQRDPLHIAGCMLYWAEGAKQRNVLGLANSDPNLLRFFRRFLVEALDIRPDDLRIRLNVYLGNDLALEEIEDHWLQILDLPRSCLRAHCINHFPTSSSGRKRNRLPYGVCTVTVARSTWAVQHIYGAIQEYGGFSEPRWLDCDPVRGPASPR